MTTASKVIGKRGGDKAFGVGLFERHRPALKLSNGRIVLVTQQPIDIVQGEAVDDQPLSTQFGKNWLYQLWLHADLTVNGVEVVVDRDARDAHRVAHVFHRTSEGERTSFIEHADGALLVFTAQLSETAAEFTLDRFNETIERTMQWSGAHNGDDDALPDEWDVAGLTLADWQHGCTERLGNGPNCKNERVTRQAHGVPCATCMVTCEAPLAKAALTSSAITVGIDSAEATHVEPKGPNSTCAPTASTADTAAVT